MRKLEPMCLLLAFVCLVATLVPAQEASLEAFAANQNRTPAGHLQNGVLTIHLEIRFGVWHPEADDGPPLYVQAFGEPGRAAQIPGPLLRVPAGTTIRATVKNTLAIKATVFGLNTRPGDPKAGVDLAPGESREVVFSAGEPGTYYYWARTTTESTFNLPRRSDAQLNGAFIVDPPGDVTPDRIFVIDSMFVKPDILHGAFEVLSVNGKLYPFTEPLEYTQGERIRWRVINADSAEHPMHLHGAFYELLSLGNFQSETKYPAGARQSVVTQTMVPGTTMMMEWVPPHQGRWLFHCHFHFHISDEERIPILLANSNAAPPKHEHQSMPMTHSMAGLVLAINIKPAPGTTATPEPATPPHKVDLVIEPTAAAGKNPTFSCSVREGKKIVASEDKSMGPPIVVARGEPVEITVLNHLAVPTVIHWHGIELESYYDGVVGGGEGSKMTPAIAPGGSFTARFTPNRAGTFIYHTHASDAAQLSGGVYGPLIVLEPGESYDPSRDRFFVLGTRDADFLSTQLTFNGEQKPGEISLRQGEKYRFRVINIAPELMADFTIGTKENLATWTPLAKDGANLPPSMVKAAPASLHLDSGETYDFEFTPNSAGDIPIQAKNALNGAAVATVLRVK